MRARLPRALLEPVDAASLAAFRILFGALMFVAVLRFFAHGWIDEYFVRPTHFFTYYGFEWVRPWPGVGMYVHFGAMAVLALFVAAGVFYRASAVLFGLLFAYAHLIDKTNYLNHYYLVVCLSFLMAALPLHRTASVDAWRTPSTRSALLPAWVLWALRGQIALVYFFAGVAKLKSDWLVDAQPMHIWLSANSDIPLVGHFFEQAWVAHVFSYAGALFDLCIVPLLLWRRARVLAYAAVVVFHVTTMRLFQLGMFPWIMMASSLLFLPPNWPRRVLNAFRFARSQPSSDATPPKVVPRMHPFVPWMLGVYFTLQVAIPLRHALYPGNVCWTEEGFRFAWNVMLMEKDGSVDFHVTEPSTGKHWEVAPTRYLTRYQAKMMAPQPDMILQLAHVIADDFRTRGVRNPEVRADAFASLNGRRHARLIDPTVDLATESDGFAPKTWILRNPSFQ